jgi:hypothetical protein
MVRFGDPPLWPLKESIGRPSRVPCAPGSSRGFRAAPIGSPSLRERTTSAWLQPSNGRLERLSACCHAKCTPVQSELLMPSRALLGRSRSRVHCYTPEEMVAEKAALLVTYGPDYTRLVDYLDLGTLAERLSFEGDLLLEAMRGTFRHRDAERMLQRMDGYWEAALDARRLRGSAEQRWAHMIDQIRPTPRPDRLRNVILKVSEFLTPVLLALRNGTEAPECWRPGSGWNRATTVQETARGQRTLPFMIAA